MRLGKKVGFKIGPVFRTSPNPSHVICVVWPILELVLVLKRLLVGFGPYVVNRLSSYRFGSHKKG